VLINKQGRGIVGMSAHLTPNSLLLLGQGDTLDRFAEKMQGVLPKTTHLRKNKGRWPPLHTSILWERSVPDRACFMLNTLEDQMTAPRPPVFSLATGGFSYNAYNAGDILCKWTDQPQQLWMAIEETFATGMRTVLHVGPAPNLIPATFRRVAENVASYTGGRLGGKALASVVCHPWLRSLLPHKSSLLCAPRVDQVILEDWLLEQPPAR
jgi:[acyl-carrier-protein] S-malonyltransferase